MSTEKTYSRAEVLDLCQKQKDQCQQMLTAAGQIEGSQHVELLHKALLSAELSVGLLQMREVDRTKSLHQALQKYIQSILDVTYYKECLLVDKDFPESTAPQSIQEILDQFSNGIKLCGNKYSEVLGILGVDILECLHWRVGALMYMFTSTVMNNDKRIKSADCNWLQECCRLGVIHMKEIFQLRATSQVEEENPTKDNRLHDLLKNGIRSDTHMLALAYGGEMCYWYTKNSPQNAATPTQAEATPTHRLSSSECKYPELYKVMESIYGMDCRSHCGRDSFDAVSVGTMFLMRYIEAARGALRLQSWQCERPDELLMELKKLT